MFEPLSAIPGLGFQERQDLVRAFVRSNKQNLLSVVDFPEEQYSRNIVFKNQGIEVMLTGWKPLRECWPHDHGGSHGLVYLIEGTALNTIYDINNGKLKKVTAKEFQSENFISMPEVYIHSMKNNSQNKRMVEMHLYWPSFSSMKIYDREKSIMYEVKGTCGAWEPREEEIIRSEHF